MRTLIVEDDFTSRLLLQQVLTPFGECHIAVNGKEAVDAFRTAQEGNIPYSLICLDIMMPEMDGHSTLRTIRALEQERGVVYGKGVKVVMTTALDDPKNVVRAFRSLCDAYIFKPIKKSELIGHITHFGLV